MSSSVTYALPVTITSVELKHDIIHQSKDASGALITHSKELGYFATIAELGISILISTTDPSIKPGTRATLRLVVPTE